MLQQTQVDRVIPYFQRFVAQFPDFEALAAAPRADVIHVWAGLGYNRRAVQLHELARIVVERHGGELPRDADALRRLPGIGPYTVGAVLSIAFGQDEPALDTNVRRVVARYLFEEEPDAKTLSAATRALVPRGRAGQWNQALMDLGATICVAQRPRCLLCPLRSGCHSAGRVAGPLEVAPKRQSTFAGSSRYYRGDSSASCVRFRTAQLRRSMKSLRIWRRAAWQSHPRAGALLARDLPGMGSHASKKCLRA